MATIAATRIAWATQSGNDSGWIAAQAATKTSNSLFVVLTTAAAMSSQTVAVFFASRCSPLLSRPIPIQQSASVPRKIPVAQSHWLPRLPR